jgi:hypothetical protein
MVKYFHSRKAGGLRNTAELDSDERFEIRRIS